MSPAEQSKEQNSGVVILGATSPVARHLALRFATAGHPILLGGRNLEECERNAKDVEVRTEQRCHALHFDAEALESHAAVWADCDAALGSPVGGVVVCFGYMADQMEAQADFALAEQMLRVNLLGAMSILEVAARDFEARKAGFIAAISSVAGDRGRQSNYFYGCAKAGLTTYLQGLRNRLHPAGVPVTTLKPGFMDTPMTAGMDLPKPLLTAPEDAAAKMYHAIVRKKNVAYIPGYWWGIMTIICSIPETVFKRLKL